VCIHIINKWRPLFVGNAFKYLYVTKIMCLKIMMLGLTVSWLYGQTLYGICYFYLILKSGIIARWCTIFMWLFWCQVTCVFEPCTIIVLIGLFTAVLYCFRYYISFSYSFLYKNMFVPNSCFVLMKCGNLYRIYGKSCGILMTQFWT